MDGNRVDKLLVAPLDAMAAPSGEGSA